jgi:hypothetical protein
VSVLRSLRRLLVTANVLPTSPILVTLMMEALSSSETSVLTTPTLRNIPESGVLHSHSRENLKSYMETDPVTGTVCFLVFNFPDDGYSPETQ